MRTTSHNFNCVRRHCNLQVGIPDLSDNSPLRVRRLLTKLMSKSPTNTLSRASSPPQIAIDVGLGQLTATITVDAIHSALLDFKCRWRCSCSMSAWKLANCCLSRGVKPDRPIPAVDFGDIASCLADNALQHWQSCRLLDD